MRLGQGWSSWWNLGFGTIFRLVFPSKYIKNNENSVKKWWTKAGKYILFNCFPTFSQLFFITFWRYFHSFLYIWKGKPIYKLFQNLDFIMRISPVQVSRLYDFICLCLRWFKGAKNLYFGCYVTYISNVAVITLLAGCMRFGHWKMLVGWGCKKKPEEGDGLLAHLALSLGIVGHCSLLVIDHCLSLVIVCHWLRLYYGSSPSTALHSYIHHNNIATL